MYLIHRYDGFFHIHFQYLKSIEFFVEFGIIKVILKVS